MNNEASRKRARQTLSLPASADAAEARSEFLRQLAQNQFLPEENQVVAAGLLVDFSAPGTDSARRELARYELLDIEEFAQSYWALHPQDRAAQHAALKKSSVTWQAQNRLEELRAGLTFEVVPLANPDSEELTALIRSLYVLPENERMARRLAWLECKNEIYKWRQVARQIRSNLDQSNSLDPVMLELIDPHIVSTPRLIQEVEPAIANLHLSLVEQSYRRVDAQQEQSATEKSPTFTRSHIFLFSIATIVIIRCFMGINSSNRSSNDIRTYSPPDRGPIILSKTFEPILSQNKVSFTDEELLAISQYDPKSKSPPPPKYALWKMLGGRQPDLIELKKLNKELRDAQKNLDDAQKALDKAKWKLTSGKESDLAEFRVRCKELRDAQKAVDDAKEESDKTKSLPPGPGGNE